MEAEKIGIKVLIICIIAVCAVETAARLIASKGLFSPMFIIGAARLTETAVIIIAVFLPEKNLNAICLYRSDLADGLRKGLLWSGGFGIVTLIVSAILLIFGINFFAMIRTGMPVSYYKIFILFFTGGIIGPVAEEFFFRGILYGFFRKWGILSALVISTSIFVLLHPIGPVIPLTQLVGGLLFAAAYEIEKNLIVPIVIHILGNMAIFTVSLIF